MIEDRALVVEELRRKSMRELSDFMADVPEDAWKVVRARMEMMARVLERSGGRVLPKGAGSAWPAIIRTAEEIRIIERETPEEDRAPLTLPFTARQVTQAEEAMFWPTYVKQAQPAAALGIWTRCQALRIRGWQDEAVRRGFSRSTAKRRLEDAFRLIVVGLVEDGKPIIDPQR